MSEIKQSFKTVMEAYPDLAAKIKLFWGHPEFTDLVQGLLTDTRTHTRQGFPLGVMAALMTLQEWHDHHYATHADAKGGPWALNSRQISSANAFANTAF